MPRAASRFTQSALTRAAKAMIAAFNERVARSRKGEKNLELAASAAAGMSHQARKAAAAIRKGE